MAFKNQADAIRYNNEFNSRQYDRINLTVPKGEKVKLQSFAKKSDESMNEFINNAIKERIERMERENSAETSDN